MWCGAVVWCGGQVESLLATFILAGGATKRLAEHFHLTY